MENDGIRFERITRTDLDDIVGLASAAWYSPDGLGDLSATALAGASLSDDERKSVTRLLATDEVCSYLADMTWGVKALLNGRVVGVIITHGTHEDPEAAARWGRIGAQAREAAEQLLARAREREEHLEAQPRVLLLVVSAEARVHGLGRRLLSQARDHFARHGAGRYWLVTDTDCDWPFYEHLGLERLAERSGTMEGAPERYFVYGGKA